MFLTMTAMLMLSLLLLASVNERVSERIAVISSYIHYITKLGSRRRRRAAVRDTVLKN